MLFCAVLVHCESLIGMSDFGGQRDHSTVQECVEWMFLPPERVTNGPQTVNRSPEGSSVFLGWWGLLALACLPQVGDDMGAGGV